MDKFEEFNTEVMSIRDGHVAHIDGKAVEIGHGDLMITMTNPEQKVLTFDYDTLHSYASILYKEFKRIIMNSLTPPEKV